MFMWNFDGAGLAFVVGERHVQARDGGVHRHEHHVLELRTSRQIGIRDSAASALFHHPLRR